MSSKKNLFAIFSKETLKMMFVTPVIKLTRPFSCQGK
jgi:hypothetical protein